MNNLISFETAKLAKKKKGLDLLIITRAIENTTYQLDFLTGNPPSDKNDIDKKLYQTMIDAALDRLSDQLKQKQDIKNSKFSFSVERGKDIAQRMTKRVKHKVGLEEDWKGEDWEGKNWM